MRTVELSDEVFARAEREAEARGIKVDELVNQFVGNGLLESAPPEKKRNRVQFPILHSSAPGTLKITKEMIDQLDLEEDLKHLGPFF